MIGIRDYETTSIAYENYLLNENYENSKLQKSNPWPRPNKPLRY
jgi:hypothetical protein